MAGALYLAIPGIIQRLVLPDDNVEAPSASTSGALAHSLREEPHLLGYSCRRRPPRKSVGTPPARASEVETLRIQSTNAEPVPPRRQPSLNGH